MIFGELRRSLHLALDVVAQGFEDGVQLSDFAYFVASHSGVFFAMYWVKPRAFFASD